MRWMSVSRVSRLPLRSSHFHFGPWKKNSDRPMFTLRLAHGNLHFGPLSGVGTLPTHIAQNVVVTLIQTFKFLVWRIPNLKFLCLACVRGRCSHMIQDDNNDANDNNAPWTIHDCIRLLVDKPNKPKRKI